MKVYAITDIGKARPINEDSFYLPKETEPFCAVADGMGGHNAGEVASAMAIQAFAEAMRRSGKRTATAIHDAVLRANAAVYQEASRDSSKRGMGTTFTALVADGRRVHIAHVGDSRIYRLREGSLTQITQDHSLVEELVRAGLITREQARTHPRRNIITRALGTHGENEPDLLVTDVQDGDVFLLCTDGLTGMVTDAQIERMLLENDMEAAADALLAAALDAGGRDNVTLILCERRGASAWNRD